MWFILDFGLQLTAFILFIMNLSFENAFLCDSFIWLPADRLNLMRLAQFSLVGECWDNNLSKFLPYKLLPRGVHSM